MEDYTQNALSEDQVLAIIQQYAEDKVDYAIMLNGPWGSGKTYFIDNRLKQELNKKKNLTYLYISLYGIKSVEQFRDELYSRIVGQFTATTQKAVNVVTLITDMMAGSNNWTQSIINGTNKLIKMREKKLIENKLSSELFLVIDDLERYEGNDYKDLLGFITSKCLNNHVHVLFVCSEDNLLSYGQEEEREKYFSIKEKSIRHTINFTAKIHSILLSIIENDEDRYPRLHEYIKDHTPELSRLFRTLENERNIRTWLVAFDCFEKFAKAYGDTIINHKFFLNILRDMIISASIYNKYRPFYDKEKQLSKEAYDTQIKNISDYINSTFEIHYAYSPFEIMYSKDTFLENPTEDYYTCKALFSFLQTGYLDYLEVKKHFDELYPIHSKYKTAYLNLMNYKILTEEEMRIAFTDLREGMRKKTV